MQGTNILGLFFICLLPVLLIITNLTVADERIDYLCNSEKFEEFPVDELGNCHEYGQDVKNYVNLISVAVIIFATTIMYAYDKTHPYIETKLQCWCEGLDWDKVVEQFPDQARVRDGHNCHIGEKVN